MKYSPFNILLPGEKGHSRLLFNSISRKICEAPEADARAILTSGKISPIMEPVLKNMSAIVESPEKQYKLAYTVFRKEKLSRKELIIVLPVTDKCNLKCTYCYQALHGDFYGNSLPSWTTESIEIATSFIRCELAENNYQGVRIRWYGGEPLLRLDLIEKMGKILRQQTIGDNKKFSGTVVTNGSLLTDRAIWILRDLNVDRLEISVDGPPEVHNVLRPYRNGKGSYKEIIESVQKAADFFDIVVFRVNIHIKNALQIEKWLTKIAPIINKPNIYLKFKLVEGDPENSLDWTLFSMLKLKYFVVARSLGLNLLQKKLTTELCPAIRNNYYIIQSDLRVYKCPQNLGSNDHVGVIGKKGTFLPNWRLNHWIDFTVENCPDCKICAHLPHCNGGCPYNQIMQLINPSSLEIYRREERCCCEKFVPELLILRIF